MIIFWILASMMLLGALCFLLPPLLRREGHDMQPIGEQENLSVYRHQRVELDAELASGALTDAQHAEASQALMRRVAEEVGGSGEKQIAISPRKLSLWSSAAVAILVPLFAVLIYRWLGNPVGLDLKAAQPVASHDIVSPEQIVAMVEGLAQRLKTSPDDAQGWAMLGRSYAVLQRYPDAVTAYARAVELLPNDAQLHADYADILAMSQGRSLEGKPSELIQTALRLDANNQKALALAGTAAFNRKDFAGAVAFWEKLQGTLPLDSADAQAVAASIAEAKRAGGVSGATTNTAGAKPNVGGQASISGVVELTSQLAGRIGTDDTLFIYARAETGPRMPLAILRGTAKELPKSFTLDDSLAMSPASKLSDHQRVIVSARISKSGRAARQAGDIESAEMSVNVGARGVKLALERIVP
jgi:cytochrome c-type biogenesis protein CcmH